MVWLLARRADTRARPGAGDQEPCVAVSVRSTKAVPLTTGDSTAVSTPAATGAELGTVTVLGEKPFLLAVTLMRTVSAALRGQDERRLVLPPDRRTVGEPLEADVRPGLPGSRRRSERDADLRPAGDPRLGRVVDRLVHEVDEAGGDLLDQLAPVEVAAQLSSEMTISVGEITRSTYATWPAGAGPGDVGAPPRDRADRGCWSARFCSSPRPSWWRCRCPTRAGRWACRPSPSGRPRSWCGVTAGGTSASTSCGCSPA